VTRTRPVLLVDQDGRLDAVRKLHGRVQQRLVDQQLVGADPGRLSGGRRRRQVVQVPLQAVAVVNGQDQQDRALRQAGG
jgi:hypothetical protein